MGNNKKYASPAIAIEMKKAFGADVKTFSVKMQHKKVVGNFVRKIEKAHKNAVKSKLVFG